ncbi:MAG: acyltransferase [Halioglobus sp.]|nr:acyltransferase [Halioglobus sp.]
MSQNCSARLKLNNFDLLRFLFAGTVCLVHAYELSGYKELGIISVFLSSKIAVEAFFVISGFLVFMSYERSSSTGSYAEKRVRRVFPAYIVAVVLCALGLVIISSLPYREYFSSQWIKYVLANLSFMNFIEHSLPGVFENNKINAVNGALWTLKIEVMFYLSVPVFVYLFRRIGCLTGLTVVYFSSVIYVFVLSVMTENTDSGLYAILSRQLPGQLSYFMAGAFFYYFLDAFEKNTTYFVATAILILCVNTEISLSFVQPFAIATLVIFFGLFLYAGNFGKFGDISYGIYILHFPIIQIFLDEAWFDEDPWLFLSGIIVVTLIGAILMWHFVEKKFLPGSSHYVFSTTSAKC